MPLQLHHPDSGFQLTLEISEGCWKHTRTQMLRASLHTSLGIFKVLKAIEEFMAPCSSVCLALCLSNSTTVCIGSALKKHQIPASWNTIPNDCNDDTHFTTAKYILLHSLTSKSKKQNPCAFRLKVL